MIILLYTHTRNRGNSGTSIVLLACLILYTPAKAKESIRNLLHGVCLHQQPHITVILVINCHCQDISPLLLRLACLHCSLVALVCNDSCRRLSGVDDLHIGQCLMIDVVPRSNKTYTHAYTASSMFPSRHLINGRWQVSSAFIKHGPLLGASTRRRLSSGAGRSHVLERSEVTLIHIQAPCTTANSVFHVLGALKVSLKVPISEVGIREGFHQNGEKRRERGRWVDNDEEKLHRLLLFLSSSP